MSARLQELITVPPVKTVIQLSDVRDHDLAAGLVADFVLTEDAEFALSTVVRDLALGRGRGYFLQGAFGTGKSHLLSLLTVLLRRGASGELIPEGRLGELARALEGKTFLTVPISLVEHASREYLEDIVLAGIEAALSTPPAAVSARMYWAAESSRGFASRKEVFSRLKEIIQEQSLAGVVFIIDELSEFLRAKPDGRNFNEDIRFLQYLGEAAPELPAWIVASLQERLEETGDIAPEAFNKIKDRYPVRLRLTGQHIKELIGRRLIHKRPGAENKIAALYARLKAALGELPFSLEELKELYPVHPATVRFLEDLKQLFSQHRGVVDFIHYQLAGDPARKIPGLLFGPADRLLTPDLIFDHFRERIRELPETNPYSEVAVRAWEATSPLADPEEQELAVRLIKILALAAMSPLPHKLTPRRLTQLTLTTVTELDPGVNYDYVSGLLDRMYREGPYLSRTEGAGAEAEYRLDLEADISLFVRRRLAYIKSNLMEEDRRVFTRLGTWVEESFLPLRSWLDEPQTERSVNWQRTVRTGRLILTALDEVSKERIQELAGDLNRTELDFVFFVGEAFATERQKKHLEEVLLPAVATAGVPGFLFWLPAEPEGGEVLQDALAYDLLAAECREGETANAQRALPYLEGVLPDYALKVREIYRQAYFKGQVFAQPGEDPVVPEQLGYLPFGTLLEKLAAPVLTRRYPRHQEVAPALSALPPGVVQALWEEFLVPGEYKAEGRAGGRLTSAIEGSLLPLGLVKKQGHNFSLNIDPDKNELVATVLTAVEKGPEPLETVYRTLRHGPFGLARESFQLFILALLASGNLEAWREGRRIGTSQLSPYTFSKIEAVGRGQVLAAELQKELLSLPFLPPRLKRASFTAALQQEVWKFLAEWKNQLLEDITAARTHLAAVKGAPALAAVSWERIESELARLEGLAGELKTSYGSREGLERFLAACRAEPYLDRYLLRLRELLGFLQGDVERVLFIHRYLTDPALELPAGSNLARQRAVLLEMLGDEATILEAEYRERLSTGFSTFQEEYRREYLTAHNRQVGSARFEPYAALRESLSYCALRALAAVDVVSVPDDLVKVERELTRILSLACTREGEDLAAFPVCRCGFTLGRTVPLPSVSELAQTMERGLREYVEALQEPGIKGDILGLAGALSEVGRGKEAAPLRELLALTPDEPNLAARLLDLLNRNTVALIKQAISGRALIVRRDLDELYENLVGRSFTPERLEAIFQEWLRGPGDLSAGCYVRPEGRREFCARESQGTAGPLLVIPDGATLEEALTALRPDGETQETVAWARVVLNHLRAEPGVATEVEAALAGGAAGLAEAVRPLTGGAAARAGCLAAARLSKTLEALPLAPAPVDYESWEDKAPLLARLDVYLAQAEAYLGAAGLLPAWPLATVKEQISQVQRTFARSFHEFTARSWQPERPTGGKAGYPMTLDGLLKGAVLRLNAPGTRLYLVFLDGLRLDLGELLCADLVQRLAYRQLGSGVLWAYLPPVTDVQLGFLREAGFHGRVTVAGEVAPSDLPYLSSEGWPGGEILRFDFIDTKVHSSPADYLTFLGEINLAAERELYPFLRALKPGARVLIFGDHGYTLGLNKEEHQSSYLHGQGLPQDTLVPWYFLERREKG